MTRSFLLFALLVGLACDPPPTEIPPGTAPTMAPERPVPPPNPPPSRPIEMDADAAPVETSTTVEPAPGTGSGGGTVTARAVGAACDTAAECASGVCEGEGCGPGKGRCAAKNRSCTRDRRPYCGCDGNTFFGSGNCPGARFSARGECAAAKAAAADGQACKVAADCLSGICEGQGCTDDKPGTCASKKRACTTDLRPYCGCDGTTFRSSSSCPGRRFDSRGECKK